MTATPLGTFLAVGDLYTAEASNVVGGIDWTIGPMPGDVLVAALAARGLHSTDISDAVDAAGIDLEVMVRRAWVPTACR
jgi:hypothetical protein